MLINIVRQPPASSQKTLLHASRSERGSLREARREAARRGQRAIGLPTLSQGQRLSTQIELMMCPMASITFLP
jgi:hypothetical protein